MPKKIAILPGDGIGPEVMAAARTVLDRAAQLDNLELEYREALDRRSGLPGIRAVHYPIRPCTFATRSMPYFLAR